MAKLLWDAVGSRQYETGVDHGVLYVRVGGAYPTGVVWNGLISVTESPSGAEATPQYADNIKYLNLVSVEEFGGTIEAFTYPDEFGVCDGTAEPQEGVLVGQQGRSAFGLVYRTRIGTDTNDDAGYKLHLIWGALAAPSEKAYNTVNDSPEAITFSWELTTTPVPVTGLKPTASITIDSTKVDPTALADLEEVLFGRDADATAEPPVTAIVPSLPLPDAVLAFFAA